MWKKHKSTSSAVLVNKKDHIVPTGKFGNWLLSKNSLEKYHTYFKNGKTQGCYDVPDANYKSYFLKVLKGLLGGHVSIKTKTVKK